MVSLGSDRVRWSDGVRFNGRLWTPLDPSNHALTFLADSGLPEGPGVPFQIWKEIQLFSTFSQKPYNMGVSGLPLNQDMP